MILFVCKLLIHAIAINSNIFNTNYYILDSSSETESDQEDFDPKYEHSKSIKGIKHLTEEQKIYIIEHVALGESFTSIGRSINKSRQSVGSFHKKFKSTNSIKNKEGQGRKAVTTPAQDRYIDIMVKQDRFITAREIQNNEIFKDISISTIKRRIKKLSPLHSYWAASKPFINRKNRSKRIKWCKEHKDWTYEQWSRVLFSDESPFTLRSKSKQRVWRLPNERYNKDCVRHTIKHDLKINVWGCFCLSGVGNIHLIEGIMDQDVYLDILGEAMIQSADLLFNRENWIFQQDNDPKHTAIRVKKYLSDEKIVLLEWPAQSPDLNPIENLWSILEQKCVNRQPNNKEELFETLKEEWNKLDKDTLKGLIESMGKRCEAVIKSKGYSTKY